MNFRSHCSDVVHPSSPQGAHPPRHFQDAISGGWALCPSLGPPHLFWSSDWCGAVCRMKDQTGQAEALWVLTGQHQGHGPQGLSRRKEKVWGQARREGPKAPVSSIALLGIGAQRSAARDSALARNPCSLGSASAQPGFPPEKVVENDQHTGPMPHQDVSAVSCPQARAQAGLDVQMGIGPLCLLGQRAPPLHSSCLG